MAELDIGDALPLYFAFRGPDGQLLDTDVELSITKPDGDTITPTPDHLDTGRWSYDLLIEQAGRYSWVWTATGAGSGVERGSFMVGASPVVATPGALDANSYITVAEADAIAAEIGLGPADEGWLDASEASKARALIRATTEIDAYVRTAGVQPQTGARASTAGRQRSGCGADHPGHPLRHLRTGGARAAQREGAGRCRHPARAGSHLVQLR